MRNNSDSLTLTRNYISKFRFMIKEYYGRITKRGSKIGRTMLVQFALSALRYNPVLAEFYKRVKSRRGHNKAIVATARKLLEFVYFILSNNLVWDDSNSGGIRSH